MSELRTIAVETNQPIKTARADAVIYPGQLLKRTEDAVDSFGLHDSLGGKPCGMLVAIEDSLQGKTVSESYASGAQARAISFLPGDLVLLRLATSQTISKGDRLISDGTGNVVEYAENSDGSYTVPVAVALEDLTTTTAEKRILAEVA